MANIDSLLVIQFIQAEIKMLKKQHERGVIDIKTLQKTARHLNNVVNFVAVNSNKQGDTDGA